MTTLLRAQDMSVSYGGVRAVADVSLEVAEGQILGLIGPNGAGKTTFIDAITGFVRSTGRVELEGRDLGGFAPHRRNRLGLSRTWQAGELFEDLNVTENLTVASGPLPLREALRRLLKTGESTAPDEEQILRLLGIDDLAQQRADSLSQGHRKLVGIGRALASKPKVVCLDEPAAGLDTSESTLLGERLRQIRDAGTSILLVDHDMGLVFAVCDYVVVLEFGRIIARGTPEEVRVNPRVLEAYLGGGQEPPDQQLAADKRLAPERSTP
jgi:ABC-type branched-subunit amino acid transport system ATPase component